MRGTPTARRGGIGSEPGWEVGDHPLVDSLNDAVIVADAGSRIVYANPATGRLLGREPGDLTGSSLLDLIPGRLRRLHLAAFSDFVASGSLRHGGRPIRVPALHADGTEVPIELLISSVNQSGGGRLVVGTLRDARDRVQVERHQEVADQLLDILAREGSMAEAAPRVLEAIGRALDWDVAALWITEPGGLRCRHVWRARDDGFARFAAATLRTSLAQDQGLPGTVLATGTTAWIVDLADGSDFPRRGDAFADGLRTVLVVPVSADGEVVGVVELLSKERREQDPALLDAMATIGERLGPFLVRVRAEEERDRLLNEIQASRRAQGFVLNASRALAEAKDYRQTLERLAHLAVPTLGDLCLIDVLDENGGLRRMAARHADPQRQPTVDELKDNYPPDPGGAHPAVEVIRSGRSKWSSEMPVEFLASTTRDERHLALISALEFTSYMAVPLIAGGTVLGAVTLVSAGSGRQFSDGDLALAENLASQVAAVVDNARVYDIEHRIARTLQRSLLPEHLHVPEGLDVAARYLPAAEGAEIGGDWYDVYPMADGRVAIVVGDVEGHDMVAASVMGRLRSVLRAYSMEAAGPAEAIGRLSQFAMSTGTARMATLLAVALDRETGRFALASAGHPPPMVVAKAGAPRMLAVRPGPPVGVAPHDYDENTGDLAIGDALLMYTDGLVESRPPAAPQAGIKRAAAVAASHRGSPEQLCAALEGEVATRGGRRDDVVFVAVQRVPRSNPTG